VVVTGQQPGVWGGPLLTLYKAITALVLARRWGDATGRPAVAVFWVPGDDTDWDEVGWLAIPGPHLRLVRHRWHPAPVPSRTWVGEARVSVPGEIVDAVRNGGLDPTFLEGEGADALDLSTRFIRFLLARFGKEGLLPLDARWPEVREAGVALWKRYLPRHRELGEAVEERGRRGEEAGLPAPLGGEALQRGLFLLDGPRRVATDSTLWETSVRAALDEERGADLAPGVLLRSVLQDRILAPAAQIVGATEAAYLDQIQPVYEELGVSVPARVPRLHATLVPPGLLPAGGEERILAGPEEWLAARARENVPEGAAKALEHLEAEVESTLDVLAGSGEGGELEQLAGSARRKMGSQIGRLREVVDKQARRRLYAEHPELRELPEFLRPRRGPQERGLSGAALPLLLGKDGPSLLREAAARHLDALAEGQVRHFLLEGTHV
jgi:uncharacterized protein YllA (UPF0747 family)